MRACVRAGVRARARVRACACVCKRACVRLKLELIMILVVVVGGEGGLEEARDGVYIKTLYQFIFHRKEGAPLSTTQKLFLDKRHHQRRHEIKVRTLA